MTKTNPTQPTIVPSAYLTAFGIETLGLNNAANLDLVEVPTKSGSIYVQPITMTDHRNRITDYIVLSNGRLLYAGRRAISWRKQFKKLQIAVDDGMAEWRIPDADCPFEELKSRLWEDNLPES